MRQNLSKGATRGGSSKKASSKRFVKRKSNYLARFQNASKPMQMVVFAISFAIIGGGIYMWRTLASDGLPSKANQVILTYEIGAPHKLFKDNFPTSHPTAMLLYGNGLMLCGNVTETLPANTDPTSHEFGFRMRQLSRKEVLQLVGRVKDAGFDQAIAQEVLDDKLMPPTHFGTFINLTSDDTRATAARFPDDSIQGFDEVELLLQAECKQATTPYDPEDVVAESVTLPNDHPDAQSITEELPEEVEAGSIVTSATNRRLKGSDAEKVKKKLSKAGKVYRRGNQAVRARYLPNVPVYEIAPSKKQSSKGKVSAANQMQTRWLLVVPSGQATPSWASSTINAVANSVRSKYTDNVNKTFDITQISVVQGSKTISQYQSCPPGYDCKVCPPGYTTSQCVANPALKIYYPSAAVYYNLQNEYKMTGVNTVVATSFNAGNGCMGLGGPLAADDSQNSVGVYNYGFAFASFGEGACDWEDARYSVMGHESGHGFGLGHTCDATLMGSCGYTKPAWPNQTIHSGQATLLRNESPYFNPYVSTAPSCPNIVMQQQITFTPLSSSTPPRRFVQSTTAPDGSKRDYYYNYSGTGTFYNHNINWIDPANASRAHSDVNGNHGILLDYSPYFNADPARKYRPTVNYHYIYRWTGQLYVQQHNTSGTPTTYTQSNGDGTGPVTDQLTETRDFPTSANNVTGPELGPCGSTGGGTETPPPPPPPPPPTNMAKQEVYRLDAANNSLLPSNIRIFNPPGYGDYNKLFTTNPTIEDVPFSLYYYEIPKSINGKLFSRIYTCTMTYNHIPPQSYGDPNSTCPKNDIDPQAPNMTNSSTIVEGVLSTTGNGATTKHYFYYGTPVASPPPVGQGNFTTRYYDYSTQKTVFGTNTTINNNWGTGSPLSGIGSDYFQVQWQGIFKSPGTGTYTFYSEQDDGFALTVNRTTIIDKWTIPATTGQGTVSLTQGQDIDMLAAMFENTGNAKAVLYWSGPGINNKQVFPNLGSASGGKCNWITRKNCR